ncbi:unnamed protein product [Heligmosomoides polygyrus]|uniref:Peptidase_S9 domain-containing protein n=1 Tax=Heligmosomoides polygyrus TaxID=6339 RepID=A0A183GQ89_HELPZ|nr:unnamed protein product [Heligmosomoides polygyrus]
MTEVSWISEAGRQSLAARSPLFYADRVTKPLLIIQGANDPRVNQRESDQFVAALQKNNIPVSYILYPDEGHGCRKAKNRLAQNGFIEKFLHTCLGGRMEPFHLGQYNSSAIVSDVGWLRLANQTHFTSDQPCAGATDLLPADAATTIRETDRVPAAHSWCKQLDLLTELNIVEAGRKSLAARSPLFYADRVRKPLLIIQGAYDNQFVAALKKNNVPVNYVLYPGDDHRVRMESNWLANLGFIEKFLHTCLGGRMEPFHQGQYNSSAIVSSRIIFSKTFAVTTGIGCLQDHRKDRICDSREGPEGEDILTEDVVLQASDFVSLQLSFSIVSQRREFEKQRVPSGVVGSAESTSERRPFLGASALHCTWPPAHADLISRLYKRLVRGPRGVATPRLPYLIKADNFDDAIATCPAHASSAPATKVTSPLNGSTRSTTSYKNATHTKQVESIGRVERAPVSGLPWYGTSGASNKDSQRESIITYISKRRASEAALERWNVANETRTSEQNDPDPPL